MPNNRFFNHLHVHKSIAATLGGIFDEQKSLPNAQLIKCVIKNRVSACLENAELSDVTFFVGECENQGQPVNVKLLEKIPGHKLLLAIASPVFKAMFFGPMAEKDFVIITDISASVFKQVLRYIYSDEKEVKDDELTQLLYAAHKYQLTDLVAWITTRIVEILQKDNFFFFLLSAWKFDIKQINDHLNAFIVNNTDWIIQEKTFLELNKDILEVILSQPKLLVSECKLFEACVLWAGEECKRKSIDNPNPQQLRSALGNLLYLFRIASFTGEEIGKTLTRLQIFSETELLDMYIFLNCHEIRAGSTLKKFKSLDKRGFLKLNLSSFSTLKEFKSLEKSSALLVTQKRIASTLGKKNAAESLTPTRTIIRSTKVRKIV